MQMFIFNYRKCLYFALHVNSNLNKHIGCILVDCWERKQEFCAELFVSLKDTGDGHQSRPPSSKCLQVCSSEQITSFYQFLHSCEIIDWILWRCPLITQANHIWNIQSGVGRNEKLCKPPSPINTPNENRKKLRSPNFQLCNFLKRNYSVQIRF